MAAAPPATSDHAGAGRGGEEGRQGGLVHLGRPAARREDRQVVRGQISRRRRARRAHRRRARVPAHRPGIRQQHPRGRRASIPPTRRISSSGRTRACSRPYLPEDVAKFYPAEHKDPDGMFASFRVWLCIIAYNTKLVKKEDAPKSYRRPARPEMEGQDRQGASGLQRHHHDRDLPDAARSRLGLSSRSWRQQNIMQVQSSADPPKRLALGERAVMADGNEYNIFQIKEKGGPVRVSLRHRRLAADRRADRHVQGGAESERRASCSATTASRRNASS